MNVFNRTDYDQQLSQEAAKEIRKQGGVVTAEQLAPFLRDPPEPKPVLARADTDTGIDASVVVDESYVLPLVLRFNGEPKVTANGTIIYKFEVSFFRLFITLIILKLIHLLNCGLFSICYLTGFVVDGH